MIIKLDKQRKQRNKFKKKFENLKNETNPQMKRKKNSKNKGIKEEDKIIFANNIISRLNDCETFEDVGNKKYYQLIKNIIYIKNF